MNTHYGIRFLLPAQLFSLGLLSVSPHIGYHEPAGSPTRRRAQTWRSLFIAPCALRETIGKGCVPWDKSASQRAWGGRVRKRLGWVGEIGDFGLVRLATASMDNPS
jgi:hypothetical protein